MTAILDDQGRLFERVNIVDVLVVTLLLAIVVSGIALATGFYASAGGEAEAAVGFEATVHPATADQLHAGLSGDHVHVTSVDQRLSVQQWLTDGGTRERTRVTFTAELPVITETSEETGVTRVYWNTNPGRERLVIGETVKLDFGTIVIDATVTQIQEVEG